MNRSEMFSTHTQKVIAWLDGCANRWLTGRECACQCRRRRFDPWVMKLPWRKKWQRTLVFLLKNPMDRGAWWLLSVGSQRAGHNWATEHTHTRMVIFPQYVSISNQQKEWIYRMLRVNDISIKVVRGGSISITTTYRWRNQCSKS